MKEKLQILKDDKQHYAMLVGKENELQREKHNLRFIQGRLKYLPNDVFKGTYEDCVKLSFNSDKELLRYFNLLPEKTRKCVDARIKDLAKVQIIIINNKNDLINKYEPYWKGVFHDCDYESGSIKDFLQFLINWIEVNIK